MTGEPLSGGLRQDEKLCPFCAEVIKKAAVKCRWCGSDLPAETPEPTTSKPVESEEAQQPEKALQSGEAQQPEKAQQPAAARTKRAVNKQLLLTAGLAVLVLLAAAGLVLAVHRANGDSVAPDGELSSSAARAGIMAEAGTLTKTAMSYRAAHADADIAAAEKLMTPAMRKKYEADLPPAADRATQAKENVAVTAAIASLSGKASCQSDDCAVSIVSATADRARVLVFVDQSATAASSKHSVASPAWELLTLVKRNGSWLIDDMAAN